MVTLELKEIVNGILYYYYFPEGKREDAGLVSINLEKKDGDVETLSKVDEVHLYSDHVINYIIDNSDKDNPLKRATIAWY